MNMIRLIMRHYTKIDFIDNMSEQQNDMEVDNPEQQEEIDDDLEDDEESDSSDEEQGEERTYLPGEALEEGQELEIDETTKILLS